MRRGTYRYICEDCGEKTNLSRVDRTRKGAIICISCGGRHLVPTSRSIATERIALCDEEEHEQKDRLKDKQNMRK